MALDEYVVNGRKVPLSDIVLTLKLSAFEGCGPFVQANRSRFDQSSSSALLDRRERAGTEERDLTFTIVLAFSNPPGQSRSQFIIGRDPKCSDVVCNSTSVSNQHIKFAVEGDHVVLYDVSSRGSSLALGNRGAQETWPKPGIPFKCILPPGCTVTLKLKDSLAFQIRVPSRDGPRLDEFRKRRDAFLANCSDLGGLSVASQVPTGSATPSHLALEKRQHMYWFAKELGRGSFGTVYMVRRVQDWQIFAAKQIVESNPRFQSMSNSQSTLKNKKNTTSGSNKRDLRREMESLQSLRHERIVRYMDWYEDVPGRWILVMEYCQHGNLEQMMRDRERPFTKSEIAEILKQTAEGLLYIHDQGITHRDLKPDNILLRSNTPLSLALADFGLANRKGGSRSRMETICGTAPYMAPEIWGAGYTNAVDIWALGVVGFALMNNGLPVPSGDRPPTYSDFAFDEIENMFNRNPSDRLVANVRKMLARDPEDRLPAAECIEDANELLDFLRSNQNQDGHVSGRSSRELSGQTFRSSEIRAIEEKEFQTSRFRAAVAAAADTTLPGQNPSHKRGTAALPRSNSLEAPSPKTPRVKPRDHLEQKGSVVPQHLNSTLVTDGHGLPKKNSPSVLPQLRPTNVRRTEQRALAQKRAAGRQLRPESPISAPQNPPLTGETARRILPSIEEEDQRPGQKGHAAAPSPMARRRSNATGATAQAGSGNETQNNPRR
ncbi:hypothetical protein CHGG_10324 [Chaetomium globosum CBS 148.51]|uniref:Protein kinase domain-containing protein n=1 Tax=Chaetomium globosum (strain ATCC 6205 / CBS 148.51 / DSM 1962 / NBRC 6347 / NRRL 1970) TaxID=306901 RepID=Q2GNY0_CHAGB|nr:uncharacterized protein CHGG_10324 [Chaetomium globosum CBS 148.51]EAQ83920.1 hypothetical protein CHGG_10324 [Chaetomium globosum CBS 148.51]